MQTARSWATLVADGLLAVALGAECTACGAPLDVMLRGPVCASCWKAVWLITPPICARCGTPLPAGWGSRTARDGACSTCRDRSRTIARERAAGHYDGALRSIVHALKYDKRRSLAGPLAALIRQQCGDVLHGADICVPVPLHWRRRWQRGFNQADLLARHLGLPVVSALRRTRHTRVQASLHANDRDMNVAGAFALRRWVRLRDRTWPGVAVPRLVQTNRIVAGLTVVLVDDVTTTGATLEACARILRTAGVREVRAATIARVAARSV
jgi:predicted amidophosphoribosyltransferase